MQVRPRASPATCITVAPRAAAAVGPWRDGPLDTADLAPSSSSSSWCCFSYVHRDKGLLGTGSPGRPPQSTFMAQLLIWPQKLILQMLLDDHRDHGLPMTETTGTISCRSEVVKQWAAMRAILTDQVWLIVRTASPSHSEHWFTTPFLLWRKVPESDALSVRLLPTFTDWCSTASGIEAIWLIRDGAGRISQWGEGMRTRPGPLPTHIAHRLWRTASINHNFSAEGKPRTGTNRIDFPSSTWPNRVESLRDYYRTALATHRTTEPMLFLFWPEQFNPFTGNKL